jgi:hypothetical protein
LIASFHSAIHGVGSFRSNVRPDNSELRPFNRDIQCPSLDSGRNRRKFFQEFGLLESFADPVSKALDTGLECRNFLLDMMLGLQVPSGVPVSKGTPEVHLFSDWIPFV